MNVAKENTHSYHMCNIGHMNFIFKLILAIMKVNMRAKIEGAATRHSRVIVLTDAHTSETITSLHYCSK